MQPQNYVANSFGFKDKVGEGVNTFLHAFYDPTFDQGTVTVKIDERVIHVIKKSLAELNTCPQAF